MEKKLVVGILFGGKSAEHEISLLSAKNVFEAIDRKKFEPVLIGIDKNGRWLLNDDKLPLLNADDPEKISLKSNGREVAMQSEKRSLLRSKYYSHLPMSDENIFSFVPIDVIFPILHGPFGEDGTIQGLLKLADIPFVGPGVLGSAVGMDKDVMKRLLREAEIPIGSFIVVKSHENYPSFQNVTLKLGSPVFIKPANMGSSVGISKVYNKNEYNAAIKKAFQYDTKIIIEEFIKGREIECAVLGNEEPSASLPGEIIPSHDFYSYEAKYLDEKGAVLKIPADLDAAAIKQIQELAIKVFQTLCCEGLSRVDFFLRENAHISHNGNTENRYDIIVNEINTMPGFTKISMYPKMWEISPFSKESGISYTDLITRLIELAVKRHEKEKQLKTSV